MTRLNLHHVFNKLEDYLLTQAGSDEQQPVSIALVNKNGDLERFIRMPNAYSRTINIAIAKAYTAAKMGVSTFDFKQRLVNEKLKKSDFMDNQLCALPGGMPIITDAMGLIGAIGISGRPLDEDHRLASMGALFIKELSLAKSTKTK